MQHTDCVAFLHWALPKLDLRWQGFRRVHGQVCKRLGRRLAALALPGLVAYQAYLVAHPEEWGVLDGLCWMPISRFYRDRDVFDALRERALPGLAAQAVRAHVPVLRAWSAGCASGEEPYTLALIWHLEIARHFPGLRFEIVATGVDPHALERARRACYQASSLKDLPAGWRETAFRRDGDEDLYWLREECRGDVEFRNEDLRTRMPYGPFNIILCRNIVFTYFAEDLQDQLAPALTQRLGPGGWLVIGRQESLNAGPLGLTPAPDCRGAFISSAAG